MSAFIPKYLYNFFLKDNSHVIQGKSVPLFGVILREIELFRIVSEYVNTLFQGVGKLGCN